MPALNDLVFNFIGKATIYPSPDRRSEVLKQVLKFCPINTAFQCVGHKNLRWQYSHDVSLESIVLFAFYKTIYMTCFGVIHSGSKNDWERAWTMNFVRLGAGVALNLDSVASITWEG